MMVMALGETRFTVTTPAPQRLEQDWQARWAPQERLGRAVALQFVGEGERRLRLAGVLFPEHFGGLAALDRLREDLRLGRILDLVDGAGRIWGRFVIEGLRERHGALRPDGIARVLDYELRLSRYAEDAAPAAAPRIGLFARPEGGGD